MALGDDVMYVYESFPTAYQATFGHVPEIGLVRRYSIVRSLIVRVVCAAEVCLLVGWLYAESCSKSTFTRTVFPLPRQIEANVKRLFAVLADNGSALQFRQFRRFLDPFGLGPIRTLSTAIMVARLEGCGIAFFHCLAAVFASNGYFAFGRVHFGVFGAMLQVAGLTAKQSIRAIGGLLEVFAALLAGGAHVAMLAVMRSPSEVAFSCAEPLAFACDLLIAPFAIHSHLLACRYVFGVD